MIDLIIDVNSKGYNYYTLCKQLHNELCICKDKKQLMDAIERFRVSQRFDIHCIVTS